MPAPQSSRRIDVRLRQASNARPIRSCPHIRHPPVIRCQSSVVKVQTPSTGAQYDRIINDSVTSPSLICANSGAQTAGRAPSAVRHDAARCPRPYGAPTASGDRRSSRPPNRRPALKPARRTAAIAHRRRRPTTTTTTTTTLLHHYTTAARRRGMGAVFPRFGPVTSPLACGSDRGLPRAVMGRAAADAASSQLRRMT